MTAPSEPQLTPGAETSPEATPQIESPSASFFAQEFDRIAAETGKPIAGAETSDTPPAPTETAPAAPAEEAPAGKLDALDILTKANTETPKAEEEDDMPMPEDVAKATPKAQNSWREMKDIIKERTRQIKELEARIEQERTRKPEVSKEEVETLKKALEEKEQRLYAADVAATTEFQEAVAKPLQSVRDAVTKLAEKREIPVKDILAAFAETDTDAQEEKLSEIASNMNDLEKIKFYEMAKEYSRLQDVRGRILSDAKEAMSRIQQHREAQAAQEQESVKATRSKALDETWQTIQERVPLFREQEGNDSWNQVLREVNDTARTLEFEALPPQDRALAAYRATLAPVLLTMLQDLHQQYNKVNTELDKIRGATPGAGGNASQQAEETIPETAGFADILRQKLSA